MGCSSSITCTHQNPWGQSTPMLQQPLYNGQPKLQELKKWGGGADFKCWWMGWIRLSWLPWSATEAMGTEHAVLWVWVPTQTHPEVREFSQACPLWSLLVTGSMNVLSKGTDSWLPCSSPVVPSLTTSFSLLDPKPRSPRHDALALTELLICPNYLWKAWLRSQSSRGGLQLREDELFFLKVLLLLLELTVFLSSFISSTLLSAMPEGHGW